MDTILKALSSIQVSGARLNNAANNIANMNTGSFSALEPLQSSSPDAVQVSFTPTRALASPDSSNVDVTAQMIDLNVDTNNIDSNIAVTRSQDAMTKSLLDIVA